MKWLCLFLICFAPPWLAAQSREVIYEQSPIRYSRRTPDDFPSRWSRTLAQGAPKLDRSSRRAFLESVLAALGVPKESQLLVFSQTSFQNSHISGESPRALYFNENHYIGYVQGGDVEIITTDPRLGMNFYTLSVPEADDPRPPVFNRNPACLACHASNAQTEFPGLLAFSVFPTESGAQIMRGTTHIIDDTRPVEDRWGGWYVTGKVEGPRHRGNVWYSPHADADAVTEEDQTLGESLESVAGFLDMRPYPVETSDVLALMVFEHQVRAHNQLAEAFGRSRVAIYADDEYMAGGELKPESLALMDAQAEALLDVFLFNDEATLERHKITGGEAFQSAFQRHAKRDGAGRSLKDFDLKDRLFRYRCSYMIHSDAFDYLPAQFKERFFAKLDAVLQGDPAEDRFGYLPTEERQAIREILVETLEQPFSGSLTAER